MIPLKKIDIFNQLQSEILKLQGFKPANQMALGAGLGIIEKAFPNATFPLGAIHEFISQESEDIAATRGFLAGLLSSLMRNDGTAIWISSQRTIFPPALKSFGLSPDRFLFLDLSKERDVLWAMEEALKCAALTTVIGEMREISFTASRRLQLAVEQSKVTGFILRNNAARLGTTACVSRWKVSSLPSEAVDGLPGIGFPQWRVELQRVRNGQPGVWNLQWRKNCLVHISGYDQASSIAYPAKQAG
jgi:protein ImuA